MSIGQSIFRAVLVLLVLFLFAPIVVVVVASFTASDFITFPPGAFSVRWYEKVLSEPEFIVPLGNSLTLAIAATALGSLLALPAAVAIVRGRFPGRAAIETFLLSPLSLPTIILAVGLLFFSARIGLSESWVGLLAGHVVVTVPYILRSLVSVYARANREVEEAAAILGAPPLRVLWHVTLPMLRPGLIAGTIFAFLISFDEVAVALLMTNSDTTTLPVSILSYLVYNYDPSIAAISAIQIGLVLAVLLVLERLVGLKTVMFTAR
ncbi:ABC transporter permease [Enterovirga sp. CN4-39]|uniref:ABC transporter permease n=1 Tax=Enterovirga sp. CN4-39 TaxID=3400910 RepID=UPI003C117B36